VIVGAGYIGLEMADALARRGLDVTVVEYLPSALTTLDPPLGNLVAEELGRHGVTVATGVAVVKIDRQGSNLVVVGSGGFQARADLALVATGVRPEVGLAAAAGIETGKRGAIRVDRAMKTNVPDVYAAGDCIETYHRFLERYDYLPLGSTAHKQGRIAGENVAGGQATFGGTLGTQVVQVFDLVAARTGLRDSEASDAGFEPLTVQIEAWDHKVYYPGAHKLYLRVTGDRDGPAAGGANRGSPIGGGFQAGGRVRRGAVQPDERRCAERHRSQLYAAPQHPMGSGAGSSPGVDREARQIVREGKDKNEFKETSSLVMPC